MIRLDKGLFDGYFTNIFRRIYIANSSKDIHSRVEVPCEINPYTDLISEYIHNVEYELMIPDGTHFDNAKIKNNKVLIAFSGGKDSVAQVIRLKKNGFSPIAFFVQGINRSYTQEINYAKKLCEILDIKLVTKKLTITGKCDYKENPIKNQLILAMMVDYGLTQDIYRYAFGNIADDYVTTCSLDYMFSDAYELFCEVEKFYKSKISKFRIMPAIPEEKYSIIIVADYDQELFQYISSCMDPIRYKATHRKQKEKKYGIQLLPDRCGSCYKCCYEAAALTYMGILDYPDDYISYCRKKLDEWNEILAPDDEDDAEWLDIKLFKKYARRIRKGV